MNTLLQRIRHRLRDIRYHSANKEQTVAGRVYFALAMLGLVACVATSFALERSVQNSLNLESAHGALSRDPDGNLRAEVFDSIEDRMRFSWPDGEIVGLFDFRREQIRRGWPSVTLTVDRRCQLDLDIFATKNAQPDATPEEAASYIGSIRAAMAEKNRTNMVEAFLNGADQRERYLLAWTFNVVLFWIAWLIMTWVLVGIGVFIGRRRHNAMLRRIRKRHHTGQCLECGYDMRGLEFNERCPECGDLVA